MYKPFGKEVKDEMLRCIGFTYTLVRRTNRFRHFTVTKNMRSVRAENSMWRVLMRCGYANLLYTRKNPWTGMYYIAYALTEKGMAWLGKQKGLRIIPPTVIERPYKEC